MRDRAIEEWPDALERVCAHLRHVRTVRVLRETGSTQDAAMAIEGADGVLVTTGRQTAGRGRLGAAWADTLEAGVACTFRVAAQAAERLAIAAAVAVAEACRDALPPERAQRVGLKWPNDVLGACDDGALRKIAGVLVEVRDARAFIGVGVNALQRSFPAELGDRAASLAQLGGSIDRLAVIERLALRLDHALSMSDDALASRFHALDRTVGLRLRFQTAAGPVEGEVLRCDPARGLEVQVADGTMWLEAATTRVEPGFWSSRSTMSDR